MTENGCVKICKNHPERPTPLIWTFVFPGAEYWCPYCGEKSGMFGDGEDVRKTPELEKTALADLEKNMEFLRGQPKTD